MATKRMTTKPHSKRTHTTPGGATSEIRIYHAPSPSPDRPSHTTALGVSCGLRLSGPEEAILAVKKGLPVSSFERLQKNLDVSTGVLASITHIAPRTLARRRKEGTLEASESQRVLRIGLLLDRATMVLGGVERARQWLKSPTKALGEKTPLEYADTEPGAKEVENLLGRIEHGVFS